MRFLVKNLTDIVADDIIFLLFGSLNFAPFFYYKKGGTYAATNALFGAIYGFLGEARRCICKNCNPAFKKAPAAKNKAAYAAINCSDGGFRCAAEG